MTPLPWTSKVAGGVNGIPNKETVGKVRHTHCRGFLIVSIGFEWPTVEAYRRAEALYFPRRISSAFMDYHSDQLYSNPLSNDLFPGVLKRELKQITPAGRGVACGLSLLQ